MSKIVHRYIVHMYKVHILIFKNADGRQTYIPEREKCQCTKKWVGITHMAQPFCIIKEGWTNGTKRAAVARNF